MSNQVALKATCTTRVFPKESLGKDIVLGWWGFAGSDCVVAMITAVYKKLSGQLELQDYKQLVRDYKPRVVCRL